MPWILPLATAAYSVYSSASSASKAKKAERGLEESLKNTPQYRPNRSILNYYDEALRRYNVAPTESSEYKAEQQLINRSANSALRNLQDRRSALAGVPSITAVKNNALVNAAVKAEQRKEQQLNRVGQAAQMKAGEEGKAFQQNEVAPFEGKYNLLAMKAAGSRADQRTSMSNLFNSANAAYSLMDGNNSFDKDYLQQNKFGNTYGRQGGNAYNWAKANNMNFGQYRRQVKKVGSLFKKVGSLLNYMY